MNSSSNSQHHHFRPSKEELQEILEEIDEDGSGEIEFGEFCQLCAKFLVEEPDEETMKAELKEAFRVYDRDGAGFITTDQLRDGRVHGVFERFRG